MFRGESRVFSPLFFVAFWRGTCYTVRRWGKQVKFLYEPVAVKRIFLGLSTKRPHVWDKSLEHISEKATVLRTVETSQQQREREPSASAGEPTRRKK